MFKIIFNIDSIKFSKSEISTQAIAEIYCEYSRATYFPYEKWNDFISTIATMWSNQLISVIEYREADFYFIDGSYFFQSSTYSTNKIRLSYYKDMRIVFSQIIEKKVFIKEVLKFLNSVINALEEKSYMQETRDYIELNRNYIEIRNRYPTFFKL